MAGGTARAWADRIAGGIAARWPAATAALAVAIALLSLSPPGEPGGVAHADKLRHLVAYGALALPLGLARPPALVPWLCLLALFGGAIELVQPLAGRETNLADFAANLAGLALGVAAGRLWSGGHR